MNARLLSSVWRMQRVASQRLRFPSAVFSYATEAATLGVVQQQQRQLLTSAAAPSGLSLPEQQTDNARAAPKERKRPPLSVEILLERLEHHRVLNGHLHYEFFSKLLEQLEAQPAAYNQMLSAAQAHILLGACGPLLPAQSAVQRLQLFERLWRYLAQHAQLQPAYALTRLQVFQHNRTALPDFKGSLAAYLVDLNAAPTAELLTELLALAGSTGNMQQATEVLAEMRARGYALTEQNFQSLLLGHARSKDLPGCQRVLESMTAAGMPLSSETQSLLVVAYLENGAAAQANEVLRRFAMQFDATQILGILRAALFVDFDAELVTQLVRELPAEFVGGAEVPIALRNLCIELLHNGKVDTVVCIIASLPTPTFAENQDIDTFGVFLLHEVFRANLDMAKIIEITQMLRDSGKNTRALLLAIEIAIRRSPPLALPLLEALRNDTIVPEELRPHYFWPLIMYNYRRYGESGVLRTLKRMSQLKVTPDAETLRAYVLPQLAVTLRQPEQALQRLDEAGVRPSTVLTPILAHLLTQQKLPEALALAEQYPSRLQLAQLIAPLSNLAVHVRATKRYALYAKLLATLVQKSDQPKLDFVGPLLLDVAASHARLAGDTRALQRLFNEMHKHGLTLSGTAFETLQTTLRQQQDSGAGAALDAEAFASVCQTLKSMCQRSLTLPTDGSTVAGGLVSSAYTTTSSSFIKHPRDMSLDELECHLIELETKRLNTRGLLRRLLQLCVRDGKLERALEIKTKCDELRVQQSPGMLASIFDLHIKLKDLASAEETLQKLQQQYPGFEIDAHKMIDYAALLVHAQQLDAGLQLLQQRASKQRIIGGDYVLKNIWNFLTCVAQQTAASASAESLPAEENRTRDTFYLLQRHGYCGPHNALLGPIVREYLLRGMLPAAVAEFERLAIKHKHTPLQFELLSLLVRLSNANGNAEEVPDAALFADINAEEAQHLLGKASAVITRVHGALNMNSALLLAFAESGTDAQLRRLLINPEFRINQELLLKNCEHLGEEGSVQTLLRLARCARGLHRVVDEQGVYTMLLRKFAKANNCAAALDLFERLEADDELKISQEFLRQLVQLLQVNNAEIPSNIALRAQIL